MVHTIPDQMPDQDTVIQWVAVCPLEQILPDSGVCALVAGKQVAVFRVGQTATVYALDNYDPFSKANVLSRGIVGDRGGIPKVASPIYKQNFNLQTGQCFDDPNISIATYPVRIVADHVEVGIVGA